MDQDKKKNISSVFNLKFAYQNHLEKIKNTHN